MEKSIIIAGFGGQGVMVCGQLIGYTVTETTDNYVTYLPAYGAEQRGGTANCFLVIADIPIGSPKPFPADYAIIMNNPSLDRFERSVAKGGAIFLNSSVVTNEPQRDGVVVVNVPAGDIAVEIGNIKVSNLVLVGALIGYSGLIQPEKVLETVYKKLGAKHPELNALNKTAFERGFEIGKAAVG
ncbi:MAG: 2-oxoacid:acceptor oxidoreductase family protein [Oscillospiraceae bacterium]|nr:2-oxoacid:acceptor oxidoreductase family protein [Oscillospiraceae bacterium]